jgi:hypothetical protein
MHTTIDFSTRNAMSELVISPAWRLGDATIEQQAIDFWQRLKILPRGIDPAARAKELCAVAWRGDELAGVATAAIEDVRIVRARFAMFRCAVVPEHRRSRVGYQLLTYSRPLLERWSFDHPDERVLGMGAVVEAEIGDWAHQPHWPLTGLTLAGYTPQGQQIRLAWFEHARV